MFLRRLFFFLVVLIVVLGYIGCANSPDPLGPPKLSSITVSPATPSIAKGLTQQFTATGQYVNGTSQPLTGATWASSNNAIVTIDANGLARGVAEGTANVTATANGVTSAATPMTITAAVFQDLTVSPTTFDIPLGTTQTFTATEVWSDGTRRATDATWSTSDPAVLQIDIAHNPTLAGVAAPTGSVCVVRSVAQGNASVSVRKGTYKTTSISGRVSPAVLDHISLTPLTPSIALGLTKQFSAVGIKTDSTQLTLTTPQWSSSDTNVATIDANGLVTPKALGTTTIRVTANSMSASTTLTVAAAAISSIAVTPLNPTIDSGATKQFTATATMTDNTTQDVTAMATWVSTNTGVATMDATTPGLAHAVAGGTSKIQATKDSVPGETTLTVNSTGRGFMYLFDCSHNVIRYAIKPDGTFDNSNSETLHLSDQQIGLDVGFAPDHTGKFLYAAGFATFGQAINGTTGSLTVIPGSPFNNLWNDNGMSTTYSMIAHPTQPIMYLGAYMGLNSGSDFSYVAKYAFDPLTGVMSDVGGQTLSNTSFMSFPRYTEKPIQMAFRPSGDRLYVIAINVGVNPSEYKLYQVSVDQSGNFGGPVWVSANGTMVLRGLAVHPTGSWVYLGSDNPGLTNGLIRQYQYDELGDLSMVSAFTPPKPVQKMVFDAVNNLLYVAAGAGSGDGSLVVYRVDSTTGGLTELSSTPLGPRISGLIDEMNLAPGGGVVYIGTLQNSTTYTYLVYGVDPTTGAATQLQNFDVYSGYVQAVVPAAPQQ